MSGRELLAVAERHVVGALADCEVIPNLRWECVSEWRLRLRFSDHSGRDLQERISSMARSREGAGRRGDAGTGRDNEHRGGALRRDAEPAVYMAMPGKAEEAGPPRCRDGGRTGNLRANCVV